MDVDALDSFANKSTPPEQALSRNLFAALAEEAIRLSSPALTLFRDQLIDELKRVGRIKAPQRALQIAYYAQAFNEEPQTFQQLLDSLNSLVAADRSNG